MKITLNHQEVCQIYRTKPEERSRGGFQSFMVSLQGRLKHNEIDLTGDDLEKIERYSQYDNGGYEGRLRKAFGRHLPHIFGVVKQTQEFF